MTLLKNEKMNIQLDCNLAKHDKQMQDIELTNLKQMEGTMAQEWGQMKSENSVLATALSKAQEELTRAIALSNQTYDWAMSMQRQLDTHGGRRAQLQKLKHDAHELLRFIFRWTDRESHMRSDLAKLDLTCQTLHEVHDYLNKFSLFNFSSKYCDDTHCESCTAHRRGSRTTHAQQLQPQHLELLPASTYNPSDTFNPSISLPVLATIESIDEFAIAASDDEDANEGGEWILATSTRHRRPTPANPPRSTSVTPAPPSRGRRTSITPAPIPSGPPSRQTSVTPGRRPSNPQTPGKLHRVYGKAGKVRQSSRAGLDKVAKNFSAM